MVQAFLFRSAASMAAWSGTEANSEDGFEPIWLVCRIRGPAALAASIDVLRVADACSALTSRWSAVLVPAAPAG